MEKEPRKQFFRAIPWIFLLLLPLLYFDLLWGNFIHFDQRIQYISSSQTVLSSTKSIINKAVEEKQDPLDFPLSRLVKDEDQETLKATSLACNSEVYSLHCVTNKPVWIDTSTMTVTIPYNQPVQDKVIRPYARQEDETLLKSVTPVTILHGNKTPPFCQHKHEVPAVVFSSSGFVGNVFHEMNEIIIPLFITARQFKSRVQFILEDYNPAFIKKYRKPLHKLTSYSIINPLKNQSVHCFSAGAVIGLKFHGHLSLNSSEIPKGLSMVHLRDFLRQSLDLKYSHVSQIETPTVMFLSRRTTRRIINEDDVVSMMEELGFRVIVVARAKVISNMELFANMINSCSVFVGAHGAGLTNEVFLPDGAVMVQVDLIGLNWAAETYYGSPARAMGVRYLRYKIEPEESSLMKIFGDRNHIAFRDPKGAFPVQAGKEVYLNGQNVKINVTRFRETMVEAMSLVRDLEL